MEEGVLIKFDGMSCEPNEQHKVPGNNRDDFFLDDDPFDLRSFELKRRSLEAGLKIEQELKDTFGFDDPAVIPGNPDEVNSRKSDEARSLASQNLNCPEELLVPVDVEDVADGLDWSLVEAEIKTITSQMSLLQTSPQKVLSLSPLKGIPLYDSSPESVKGSPKKTPRKAPACKTPVKNDIGLLKQALEKVKSNSKPPPQPSRRPNESPAVRGRQPYLRRSGSLPMRGKNVVRKPEAPARSNTTLQKPEPKAVPKAEPSACRVSLRPPVKPTIPTVKAPIRTAISLRGDSSSRNSSTNSSINSSAGSLRSLPAGRKGPMKATVPLLPNFRNLTLGSSSNDSSDTSRSSIATPTRGGAPAAASTPALGGPNSSLSSKLRAPQLRTPSKVPLTLTPSFASPIPVVPKFQLDRQKSLPLANNNTKSSPVKSSNVLGESNTSGVSMPKGAMRPPQLRKPMFARPAKTNKENIPASDK